MICVAGEGGEARVRVESTRVLRRRFRQCFVWVSKTCRAMEKSTRSKEISQASNPTRLISPLPFRLSAGATLGAYLLVVINAIRGPTDTSSCLKHSVSFAPSQDPPQVPSTSSRHIILRIASLVLALLSLFFPFLPILRTRHLIHRHCRR